jgi:Cation transporter/ATPase, N-terminus
VTGPAEVPVASPAAGAGGPAWHTLSTGQVLQEEQVGERDGLSPAEVSARARRFGPNKFATGKAESRWHAFLRQYADPMQVVPPVSKGTEAVGEPGTPLGDRTGMVYMNTNVTRCGLYDNLVKYVRFQMSCLTRRGAAAQ